MNEIQKIGDIELIEVLRNSLYPDATDDSIKLVIGYCKASGLDVMQKPVYIVPMWDSKARSNRDVLMPGIKNSATCPLFRARLTVTRHHCG